MPLAEIFSSTYNSTKYSTTNSTLHALSFLIDDHSEQAPAPARIPIHEQAPFLGVMCAMRDASLPLTVHEFDEWGDPGSCEAAEAAIRSYCPYENVRSQEYPALMVTASLNDTRFAAVFTLTFCGICWWSSSFFLLSLPMKRSV